MSCPNCGSDDVAVSDQTMVRGTPYRGYDCQDCPHEWGDIDL